MKIKIEEIEDKNGDRQLKAGQIIITSRAMYLLAEIDTDDYGNSDFVLIYLNEKGGLTCYLVDDLIKDTVEDLKIWFGINLPLEKVRKVIDDCELIVRY